MTDVLYIHIYVKILADIRKLDKIDPISYSIVVLATPVPHMRKEVIFAIVIGALFGVAIVLGIKRINTSTTTQVTKTTQNQNIAVDQEDADDQNTPRATTLAVLNPQDNDVLTENSIEISGLTSPESWVILLSPGEEQITQASTSGEFSFAVELSGGINKYKLISVDERGQEKSKELTLVYTSQIEE